MTLKIILKESLRGYVMAVQAEKRQDPILTTVAQL